MVKDASSWPEECTLIWCEDPKKRPHHHHLQDGRLSRTACTCNRVDQPGTRP